MVSASATKLPGPLVIYGAYGKTGSMIARAAVERGHEVVLSGADRERLRRYSGEMRLPGVAIRLEEAGALRQLIRPAACVIHVAGPFETTFRPMVEACNAERVPYLDLNGELDVFRTMEGLLDARPLAIPVLSGCGFGVVAGESAAMHAVSKLRRADRVWLGLKPDLGTRSRAAIASTLRTLAQDGAVVENGRFVAERMARRSFKATLAGRQETFVSMPLGELWAVRRSTGVSTAIVGVARPRPERILLRSGVLPLLARSARIRNWMTARAGNSEPSPQRTFESKVWARAEDGEGRAAEVILEMGEGYQWSANAAVLAAERLATERRPGFWTPGQYLGKEFALSVPTTNLVESAVGAAR